MDDQYDVDLDEDRDELRTALLEVGRRDVPAGVINIWSDEQRSQAAKWVRSLMSGRPIDEPGHIFIWAERPDDAPPRRGNWSSTCRRCVECVDESHHMSEVTFEMADTSPTHPAALLGVRIWMECRHCDAWLEWTGDDEDDVPLSIAAFDRHSSDGRLSREFWEFS